jgi:D-beta-D-heptose 7-phosphate kinase/D-beta-D-heptose 1-phosphate adenosyltransferase
LKRQKVWGDVLIVAINSDKSLSCLKCPKRPLSVEKKERNYFFFLKSVGYVVVFGERPPEKILSELRPDILVKGGDYRLSEIVGRKYVKKSLQVSFCKREIADRFDKFNSKPLWL